MSNVKLVSRYGIPYEVGGTFLNGDVKLTIYGSLKQFDQLNAKGIVTSGRFDSNELTPINDEEADLLLKIALRDNYVNLNNTKPLTYPQYNNDLSQHNITLDDNTFKRWYKVMGISKESADQSSISLEHGNHMFFATPTDKVNDLIFELMFDYDGKIPVTNGHPSKEHLYVLLEYTTIKYDGTPINAVAIELASENNIDLSKESGIL